MIEARPEGLTYTTVAASQTAQALGTKADVGGSLLANILVVPATTSPGNVQIKDGSDTAITVFTGGASSVADLKPFLIPVNLRNKTGLWAITTGTNVSVVASGSW